MLTGTSALPYAMLMNGTAAMEASSATENTISASLNRHGNRLVQCFVFSKMLIIVFPYGFRTPPNSV